MAYTKEPRELMELLVEGSVEVRKIRFEVSRLVIWTWRVVCGKEGRVMAIVCGRRVGDGEISVCLVDWGFSIIRGMVQPSGMS